MLGRSFVEVQTVLLRSCSGIRAVDSVVAPEDDADQSA